MKKVLIISIIAALFTIGCSQKKSQIGIAQLAEKSQEYKTKIANLESRLNPQDIDAFMQINDSITLMQQQADSVLGALFTTITDTIVLDFIQTKNENRIQIQKVWVTGAKYNELHIQALVKAIENSSFMGPYTSATMIDNTGKKIEVGGGIGGAPDTKLVAGQVYTFTGTIDNLHLLANLKQLQFDEEIKKW
ncbi:MAG TPA: hypothetical protein PLS12_09150 [Bacteroidales bacterium]|nr:hypothetical protein [Bacteroidales bacterium]